MEESWMKNDEGWMKKDDDFKLLRGFVTDWRTDICEYRVAFATENGLPGVTDKARMADSENEKK